MELLDILREQRKEDLDVLRRELDQRLGSQDRALSRIEEKVSLAAEAHGERIKSLEDTRSRAKGAAWIVGIIFLAFEAVIRILKPGP
jgi:hypothetical protein